MNMHKASYLERSLIEVWIILDIGTEELINVFSINVAVYL